MPLASVTVTVVTPSEMVKVGIAYAEPAKRVTPRATANISFFIFIFLPTLFVTVLGFWLTAYRLISQGPCQAGKVLHYY